MAGVVDAVKQVAELLLYKVQCGEIPATPDGLDSFLLTLETNDESFHRFVYLHNTISPSTEPNSYDLIRHVRTAIATALAPFIQSVVPRINDDTQIAAIVSKFTASEEYADQLPQVDSYDYYRYTIKIEALTHDLGSAAQSVVCYSCSLL